MNSSEDPFSTHPRPTSGGRPISRRDAHLLAGQLSELTSGNLPVVPGLRAFAEELEGPGNQNRNLRRHLLKLAKSLEDGKSVDDSLDDAGAPRDLMFALRTGIATGHPDRTLADYVSYAKSSSELWMRMIIGLAPPTILLCLMIAVFLAILIFLIPMFRVIFEDFGIELPILTISLIASADFIGKYGWLLLTLLVVGIVGLRIWSRTDPHVFPKLLRMVPFFGSVSRFSTMSRFCYALGFMTEHEVELPVAVRFAGEATDDPEMIRVTREWASRMDDGMSLEEASSRLDQLPMELIRSCQWESRPEILASSLKSLGSMYSARALNLTLLIASMAEPIIIILVGLMVFLTIAAMFLPLVKLLNDLS